MTGSLFRKTTLLVALMLAVILVAASFAEYQNRQLFEQQLRADVLTRVSVIRAKLEGNINGNIQLVQGLAATLSTEPGMSQKRFAQLSSALLNERSQIRNIAGAPNMVISLMYPLEGNERAIGLDYRNNAEQRDTVLRARDTGMLVLAGPVNLVQGGKGFIGRLPVFHREGGRDYFWGILSAVVDADRLYRDSGLLDPQLGLDIAISGRDGGGTGAEDVFFGDATVIGSDPVRVDVLLPSGRWEIAAVPKGGWSATPPNTWTLRILMLLAAALILGPTLLTTRLLGERQRYIGALRQRESDLGRLSRRLGLALETSRVGVWETDVERGTEYWDDRTSEIYGYPPQTAPRTPGHWLARVHPEDRARAEREFQQAIELRVDYRSEYRLLLDGGEVRYVRAIAQYLDAPGEGPRYVGVNWDVSADVARAQDLLHAKLLSEARNRELEIAKASIEHNSLHDSLTGLPNRRYLDEQLAQHIGAFIDGRERAALLHLDLDRFKQINDTLGHAAGDAMLLHVASILRSVIEAGDFVARVGGDEFVILLRRPLTSGEPNPRQLSKLADDILDRVRVPVLHEGHECRVGVSIGIASDTDTIADPEQLLVHADIALYRAKSLGRNRFQFFNDALQADIVNTKRVADEILTALENDQFTVHYQPQINAETLEIIGVEALARWNHPTSGLLAPAAFLRVAEELNVVAAIDRLVLEKSLRDMEKWADQGINVPKVSVNVSAKRLHDEELVGSLGKLNIKPGTLSFELVESIFLDEQDELVTWNVDRIKELGIDIEIDDFGTGHASIVSLVKLKPSRLKIDRQLVMPIAHSPSQRQLVKSIIEIGRSLGIEVLAEGVETMEHARMLRGLGCHALQGYAFGRPMSADLITAFVKGRHWREAC